MSKALINREAPKHAPCGLDIYQLDPADLLNPEQAAGVLGLSVKTLATWRSTGRHALPFIRCGARIRYRRGDLTAWLQGRQHTSTGEKVIHDAQVHQKEEDRLPAKPSPTPVQVMRFEYKHPDTGEERAVVITRDDVLANMEYELFEKLVEQLCQCEPIGETNVIDCRCDEHAEEFVLLSDRPTAHPTTMTLATTDVLTERRRQVEAEGWTREHDDTHGHGQLARAAACYALSGSCSQGDETAAMLVDLAWPWPARWWKPTTSRRDLVKAAALILAEIERLDRAALAGKGGA